MSPYTESEIQQASGAEQARLIRERAISLVDAVDAALSRIEELNPTLYAFCVIAEEQAKETAREVKRAVEDGESLGPLHGVPVEIKDFIAIEGIRTTFGSRMYQEFVPDRDSVVVQWIKDAGGIVLGETKVPEFGYQGITDNARSYHTTSRVKSRPRCQRRVSLQSPDRGERRRRPQFCVADSLAIPSNSLV